MQYNINDFKKLPNEIVLKGEISTGDVWLFTNEWHYIDPAESLKIKNHSPTGFAWGYSGSGPAQLALAIMLKFFLPADALSLYQHFKFNVIAALPQSDFMKTINLNREIFKILTQQQIY